MSSDEGYEGSWNLEYDSKYKKEFEELQNLYFDTAYETGLFAMCLGIRMGERAESEKWEGRVSWSNTDRFQGYGFGDFFKLFKSLEITQPGKTSGQLMNEYTSGGLKLIEKFALHEEGNLEELKTMIPELFEEDEETPGFR